MSQVAECNQVADGMGERFLAVSKWWWFALAFALTIAMGGALPARAAPPPSLVITEVFARPLLVSDRIGEFVEILNQSDEAIELADLRLTVPSGKALRLHGGSRHVLPAGAIAVVRPALREGARAGPLDVVAKGLRLPNRGGRLELRWRGQLVDVAQWWGKWPWPKSRPGRSLERRKLGRDGAKGRSWRRSTTPLRGVERASPGVVHWWSRGGKRRGVLRMAPSSRPGSSLRPVVVRAATRPARRWRAAPSSARPLRGAGAGVGAPRRR